MEHLEYKKARNYSRRMLIDILIFFLYIESMYKNRGNASKP